MMDEYDATMERDRCYINPFVGEGRYARYLQNWLSIVPASQMLLLNFDEWTSDAEVTMRRVFAFLQLQPFAITIEHAHNTHLARSVHVSIDGASNLSTVAANSLADAISFRTHCILHEFYVPYQRELDELLKQHGYAPMRWDTAHKAGQPCPSGFRHWPERAVSVRRVSEGGGEDDGEEELEDGGDEEERAGGGGGGDADGDLRAELLAARTRGRPAI